jgi:hypothetical protein
MTPRVVVLSSAKDLDLIVILNGVKNLVLLFSKSKSRFFALRTRAQNDTGRSFGQKTGLRRPESEILRCAQDDRALRQGQILRRLRLLRMTGAGIMKKAPINDGGFL